MYDVIDERRNGSRVPQLHNSLGFEPSTASALASSYFSL
jgi:hypothetical protein